MQLSPTLTRRQLAALGIALAFAPAAAALASEAPAAKSAASTAADADASADPQINLAEVTDDGKIVVTDGDGRVVELDAPAESVVTVYGLKYAYALGLADQVLNGANTNDFYQLLDPELPDRPFMMDSGGINVEVIADMEPDVFIHRTGNDDLFGQLTSLGIPCIALHMETVEEVKSTLAMLGVVFGREGRAAELASYFEGLMDDAAALTADIAEEDRPTAILMGLDLGKVAHGDMIQSVMMQTAGAVNLAADVQSSSIWPEVGVEQIFEWDPDYIFFENSNSRSYEVEDLYTDPTWANLKAVQNGNLYVVPSDLDSWEYPGVQVGLGTLWMAQVLHPELLSDEDFEAAATDFYQKVYGAELDRETLGF